MAFMTAKHVGGPWPAGLELGWQMLCGLCLWLGACSAEQPATPSTTTLVQLELAEALQSSTVAIDLQTKGADGLAELASTEPRVDRLNNLGAKDFPVTVAMQPRKNDDTRVFALYAKALDQQGETVAWGRVVSEYVTGSTRYVRLVLDSLCAEQSCQETQTCVQNTCAGAQVLPASSLNAAQPAQHAEDPGETELPTLCEGLPCDHGSCAIDATTQAPLCVCQPGYVGDECGEAVDYCDQLQCANGGKCEQDAEGAFCNCPQGYAGSECEHDQDDCAGVTSCSPGHCIDGVATYHCECPDDYDSSDPQACTAATFREPLVFPAYNAQTSVSLAEDGNGALVSQNALWLYRKGHGFEPNAGPPLTALSASSEFYLRITTAAINGHVIANYNSLVDTDANYTGVVDINTGLWTGLRAQLDDSLVPLASNHVDLADVNIQSTGELQRWNQDGFVRVEDVPLTGPEPSFVSMTPDGRQVFVIEWHPAALNYTWHALIDGELYRTETFALDEKIIGNASITLHNGEFGLLRNGSWELSFAPQTRFERAEGPYAGQPTGVDAQGNIVTFTIDEQNDSLVLATFDATNETWTFHPPIMRSEAQMHALEGVDLTNVGPWLSRNAVIDVAPNGNALLAWTSESLNSGLLHMHAVRYRKDTGLQVIHTLGTGWGSLDARVDGVGHGLVHWRSNSMEAQVVALH